METPTAAASATSKAGQDHLEVGSDGTEAGLVGDPVEVEDEQLEEGKIPLGNDRHTLGTSLHRKKD